MGADEDLRLHFEAVSNFDDGIRDSAVTRLKHAGKAGIPCTLHAGSAIGNVSAIHRNSSVLSPTCSMAPCPPIIASGLLQP